jgi:hypothetical protein
VLHAATLGLKYMQGRVTASAAAEVIEDIVDRFQHGLHVLVSTLTCDKGANIVLGGSMFMDSPEDVADCFAHDVQLALKDVITTDDGQLRCALTSFSLLTASLLVFTGLRNLTACRCASVLSKVRRIVSLIRGSATHSETLKRLCSTEGAFKALINPTPTRWSSDYMMINRYISLSWTSFPVVHLC